MAKKAAKNVVAKSAKKKQGTKKTAKKRAAKAGKKIKGRAKSANAVDDEPDGERLIPPSGGAVVRFYRIGHGDCFLLAFPSKSVDKPVYVLIDCGYKPGSPGHINTSAAEVWDDIRAATGGHIHVTVITHEHQDHVNGITQKNVAGITIGETWLAWTEDPEDDLAKRLRRIHKDRLQGLAAARMRLAAAGEGGQSAAIDEFLEFELGGSDDNPFQFAAAVGLLGAAGGGSANKNSMQIFKDLAEKPVRFIRPHQRVMKLPGAAEVRAFALGPPRDEALLEDLDPRGGEEFHSVALSASSPSSYFAAAAQAQAGDSQPTPFAPRYVVKTADALTDEGHGRFFSEHYGGSNVAEGFAAARVEPGPDEAFDNPAWRRIDNDWLGSAGQLALAMNSYTNNTSLVLAFELGVGGKVLLFAADAQRGNWLSWSKKSWRDGDRTVTTKDLFSRVVLYKAGHHCSHNATLNGVDRDKYANVGWMAQGEHAAEFTAMITAVRSWAETQKGWNHPFPPIKEALLKKASGRVLQTDTNLADTTKPDDVSAKVWQQFQKSVRGTRLYFDLTVHG